MENGAHIPEVPSHQPTIVKQQQQLQLQLQQQQQQQQQRQMASENPNSIKWKCTRQSETLNDQDLHVSF